MDNRRAVIYASGIFGAPMGSAARVGKNSRGARVGRIAYALRYASDEDLILVERVMELHLQKCGGRIR